MKLVITLIFYVIISILIRLMLPREWGPSEFAISTLCTIVAIFIAFVVEMLCETRSLIKEIKEKLK